MLTRQTLKRLLIQTIPFFLSMPGALAALRLPAVISDHMVLQAGKPDALWGWANPGEQIKIAMLDGSKTKTLAEANAVAGKDGRWQAQLPALPSGATGVLRITAGKGEEKYVNDVIVGEVWLGSGQSNMTYRIHAPATTPAVGEAVKENMKIAQKEAVDNKPFLRYFEPAEKGADTPQDDVVGEWKVVDPESVGKCSAVAWNFGVALREKLHVPVGMIASSVGATPVEAWMPKEALESIPAGGEVMEQNRKMLAQYTPEAQKKYEEALAAWEAANKAAHGKALNNKQKPAKPYSPTDNRVPSRLYNAMIHGLEPYTVQGILWFQSATAVPTKYGELISALVKSWREHWGVELPFYYVEVNNWKEAQRDPVQLDSHFPGNREQQEGVLRLPKTGVVTSVDLGMVDEVHFPNKKPVGQRLAGMALADVYGIGDPNLMRSPEFSGSEVQGDKMRLHIKYANGLRLRGDSLKGFAVCGADGKWVWAEGKIDGKDILVWSKEVSRPVAARYGWAENPILSVESQTGLPLRPFRTDKDKTF